MGQPGMRITVDAAMRARDVSRPRPDGAPDPAPGAARRADGASGTSGSAGTGERGEPRRTEPARRSRAAKNERRRLGKRGGARKVPENEL
ncbi:hypothetical protein [Actinomadura opuntiae]|uniref:hypothetical protein n=1 Tax=Actinomadura sp. OS1-43 TaxID=604315 RepID=UPI00255AD441|nr:hypothetical protein [Actinomadura sp. OS1-43]MDL4819390.1 hypothetical protein [Actinomadura sp. OS1-43]